jgi:Gene product 88
MRASSSEVGRNPAVSPSCRTCSAWHTAGTLTPSGTSSGAPVSSSVEYHSRTFSSTANARRYGTICGTGKVQALMRYEQSKNRRGVLVLRISVLGDFYRPGYTAKWVEIARRSPNTRFFGYTRSCRIAPIVPYLHALALLENVRLWYSADAEAYPDDVPENVRVSYLQHDANVPDWGDLIFQVRKQRAKPGMIPLPLVCGQETPEGKTKGVNCANCGICWR